MYAVGPGGHRDVDAVIHQQTRAVASAARAQRDGELIQVVPAKILFAELKRGVDGRWIAREGSQYLVTHLSKIAWCNQSAVANQVELEVDRRTQVAVQAETLVNQLAKRTRGRGVELLLDAPGQISRPPGFDRELHRVRHRDRV